jgi:hypothetical protein
MFVLFNTGKSNNNAIDLHVENDRIVINEQEHLLSDVKARTDFRPYCKMTFPLKQTSVDQRTIQDAQGGSHSYPYSLPPFDIFTHTAESKYTQYELSLFTHHIYDVSFMFFPHHNTFKDAVLCVLATTDPNVPFNITTKNNEDIVPYIPDKTITEITGWADNIYPKCSLYLLNTATVNDQTVHTLEFVYNDLDETPVVCDFTATVKSNKGYLSHQKLDVVDGKAQFKYIPFGLDPTDKADIQVGIGKYSYIAKLTV